MRRLNCKLEVKEIIRQLSGSDRDILGVGKDCGKQELSDVPKGEASAYL